MNLHQARIVILRPLTEGRGHGAVHHRCNRRRRRVIGVDGALLKVRAATA